MSAPELESSMSSNLLLSARGMVKQYPGVRAVDGVDLDLRAGEVHGLVGENGAGKSTLIKLLTGAATPDSGSIRVNGELVNFHGPRDASASGIAVVHQEPSLVPGLSPCANAFLGAPLRRFGVMRTREMTRQFHTLASELGLELADDGDSGSLSIAAQQQIEIVRALQRRAQVVILDEPTAALGQSERIALLRTVSSLKQQGTAVLYISHHLDEVLEVCDVVTVLRSGRRIATERTQSMSQARLVEAMVGRVIDRIERPASAVGHTGDSAHEASRLTITGVRTPYLDIERLDVAPGEVVGLAGLVGSGRSSLLRILAGSRPERGTMHIDGAAVPWPRTPAKARARGIALAPEDRRTQGLVLGMSSSENILLPARRAVSRSGIRRLKSSRILVARLAAAVRLPSAKINVPTLALSGGNQQKVVLAGLLATRPKIVLIDEPMRGIDVGAKSEVFQVIADAASDGAAVIIASEETDDLIEFCDRVLVMRKGHLINPDIASEPETAIYNAMLGIAHQEPLIAEAIS